MQIIKIALNQSQGSHFCNTPADIQISRNRYILILTIQPSASSLFRSNEAGALCVYFR